MTVTQRILTKELDFFLFFLGNKNVLDQKVVFDVKKELINTTKM